VRRWFRRDEPQEVSRCLNEALREPRFASAIVLFVSGIGRDGKCEIAVRPLLGAPATNGKGC